MIDVLVPRSVIGTVVSRPVQRLLGAVLMLGAVGPTAAQTTLAEDPFDDALAPPIARESKHLPTLDFDLLAEVPLPGPLPAERLRKDGDHVEVAVTGGVARVRPEPGAVAVIAPQPATAPPESDVWSESPDGKFRFRSMPNGFIVAERRCPGCRRGWKKTWKLRVSGTTRVPPVSVGPYVFFAAMDNRVYCVKRRNGHRVWSADAGGRIAHPLVVATILPEPLGVDRVDGADDPRTVDRNTVLLVVPESGARLLALNPDDGLKLAQLDFGNGDGTIVGGPLVVDEGQLVITRQRYRRSDASLLVYALTRSEPRQAREVKKDPDDLSEQPSIPGRR